MLNQKLEPDDRVRARTGIAEAESGFRARHRLNSWAKLLRGDHAEQRYGMRQLRVRPPHHCAQEYLPTSMESSDGKAAGPDLQRLQEPLRLRRQRPAVRAGGDGRRRARMAALHLE